FVEGGLPLLLPHPKLFAVLAATGVILGAVYMLWMFQKVMFGPLANPRNQTLSDLTFREKCVFAPVLALIFVMGLYPAPFLRRMDASIARVMGEYKRKLDESIKIGEGTPSLLPVTSVGISEKNEPPKRQDAKMIGSLRGTAPLGLLLEPGIAGNSQ